MKHFTRTENGTTQHLSARDALAEINHAMMDGKRYVRTMSSDGGGSKHAIEYKDGRKVKFARMDGAAPVTAPEGYTEGQAVTVHRPGKTPFTGTVAHTHSASGFVAVLTDRHRSVSNYPTSFVSPAETKNEPAEEAPQEATDWATTHSGFTAHRFNADHKALCNRAYWARTFARMHDDYQARAFFADSSAFRICPRCDAK